jgi:hypothetical protein
MGKGKGIYSDTNEWINFNISCIKCICAGLDDLPMGTAAADGKTVHGIQVASTGPPPQKEGRTFGFLNKLKCKLLAWHWHGL